MKSVKGKPSRSVKTTKNVETKRSETIRLSLQPKRHFNFDNGDEYDGEFAINMDTRSIVRHGFGTYTTISCVRFEGRWQNDILIDIVKILYPNGHWFEGRIDGKLNAMIGTLFLVDGCKFVGEFSRKIVKNVTVYGTMDFIDRNERQWNVEIKDDVIHLTRDRFI